MHQRKLEVEFDKYLDYVQDRRSMGDVVLSESSWLRMRDLQIVDLLWGQRDGS